MNALAPCLVALTAEQKWIVNDQLSNNDAASDDELVAYWIDECGLSAAAAKAAITFRDEAFRDPFFELFDDVAPPAARP